MVSSKSSNSVARAAQRKRARNRSLRTKIKSNIDKAEDLIYQKDIEPAQKAVTAAAGILDRAVIKGVIHRNKAARQKSRLTKKLNKTQASPS